MQGSKKKVNAKLKDSMSLSVRNVWLQGAYALVRKEIDAQD